MKFALRNLSPEIKIAVLGLAALLVFATLGRGEDALAAANAERAARGLPPFQYDPGLAAAAEAAATYRASYGIAGHTANDFQFLPAGASAPAAGCAAWPDGMGFGSCCLHESWTYAGAATVRGRNGLLFHHLFVSHQASAGQPQKLPAPKPVPPAVTPPVASTCGAATACGSMTVRHTLHVRERIAVINPLIYQPVRTFFRGRFGHRCG
jgi:hypothetical protein